MPLLSGILALLAISLYSAVLARRFKLDAGLLALPVIAGGAVWLCLWGMAGLLKAGGWAFYLAAAALAASGYPTTSSRSSPACSSAWYRGMSCVGSIPSWTVAMPWEAY